MNCHIIDLYNINIYCTCADLSDLLNAIIPPRAVNWSVYHNLLLNENNCPLTSYLKECEFAGKCAILHLDSLDNLYAMYTFMNLGVIRLDYYVCMYIKLKSALNISYDVTLSTDTCDIIVLTQNKSLYHSFYVCIYWNQAS